MAISATTTTPPATAATTSPFAALTNAPTSSVGIDTQTIASNFTDFLKLLTTQLKNQNPLDPLDTNQFTQQLVQFAQVEQQLKSNDQLTTLVSLQQAQMSTIALDFVGQTVAVDGKAAPLANGSATWTLQSPKPATANFTITAPNGQVAYSGALTLNAGTQPVVWNGVDANGTQWPDGMYTLTVNAKDTTGQPVTVATEIQGTVDSVNMTQNPPTLSIAGQDYTLDKIKRVIRHN